MLTYLPSTRPHFLRAPPSNQLIPGNQALALKPWSVFRRETTVPGERNMVRRKVEGKNVTF